MSELGDIFLFFATLWIGRSISTIIDLVCNLYLIVYALLFLFDNGEIHLPHSLFPSVIFSGYFIHVCVCKIIPIVKFGKCNGIKILQK